MLFNFLCFSIKTSYRFSSMTGVRGPKVVDGRAQPDRTQVGCPSVPYGFCHVDLNSVFFRSKKNCQLMWTFTLSVEGKSGRAKHVLVCFRQPFRSFSQLCLSRSIWSVFRQSPQRQRFTVFIFINHDDGWTSKDPYLLATFF